MARPRTYNEGEIITKAMHAFWNKGFAATSISDLEDATGLKRTSLYAAFGDKQGLYIKCLETYKEMGQEQADLLLQPSEDPVQEIYNWFIKNINQGLGDPERKGCFFNNACSERGSTCTETKSLLSENRKAVLERFALKLEEAKSLGQIKQESDVASLANFLFSLQSGLMINLKNGASKEELFAALDTGMQCFPTLTIGR